MRAMDFDQPPVVRVEADPERPLPGDRWPADIAVASLRDGLTLQACVLVGETVGRRLVEAVAMAYGLGSEGGSTGSRSSTSSATASPSWP